jgi:two-component system chemotaxis sensor kinase CheA
MSEFSEAFFDDYFAECEEHLASIRQALLALEHSVGHARPDVSVTEELFRGYHSLKGLAGMVEDRHGELLAHEMESYLRALREGEATLTTAGLETLIDGTAALEQVTMALRTRQVPPDTDAVVAALRELAAASGGSASHVTGAAGTGKPGPLVECVFTPSVSLAARGINVNAVRARLQEHGEIVSASPLVGADGAIAFRFLVNGEVDAAAAASWREDGMAVQRVDEPDLPRPALAAPGAAAPAHYVRVDLNRLDDLMRMVGDMVIRRARLADALARVERYVPATDWRAIQENAAGIERQLRDFRDGIMRVRLVPVGEIFRRMPFVVRDLARETARRVHVTLSGQETQIDKFLVERMMDPVLHLVRNAVSHGIESVSERIAAGKPPDGTIALSAHAVGEIVRLEIADDGRGVDERRVIARARQAGLIVESGGEVDSPALLDMICAPGFSTRDETDRASGRGFGMSVVRTTVQELGGTLRLISEPGRGTRFVIDLPLTLAITDALIASVGAHTFAVPQNAVREVVEVEETRVRIIEGGEIVPFRGTALPVVRLSRALGVDAAPQSRRHVFVLQGAEDAAGVLVDRVLTQREIVVKTTTDPLIRVPGVTGATDLGDGRAVLILDLAAIVRLVRGDRAAPWPQMKEPA